MWTKTTYIHDSITKSLRDEYKLRVRDKLSASDTGCLLQRQLKLLKIEPDREPTDSELITFDYGNMLHKYLQDRLKGLDEVEVEDENFLGHIDKVTKENGEHVVNEFKGIKDYGIDMIIKEGDKPKPEHVRQVTNYVRMLKKGGGKVSNKYRIVYVAKCFDDNHRKFIYERKNPELANGKVTIRMVEYTGEYDPKLAQDIVEEAIMVKKATDKRDLLKCSEWDKVYHRNDKWNNFISWCSGTPEENAKRLEALNGKV